MSSDAEVSGLSKLISELESEVKVAQARSARWR